MCGSGLGKWGSGKVGKRERGGASHGFGSEMWRRFGWGEGASLRGGGRGARRKRGQERKKGGPFASVMEPNGTVSRLGSMPKIFFDVGPKRDNAFIAKVHGVACFGSAIYKWL